MKRKLDAAFLLKAAFCVALVLWLTGIIQLPILNTPLFHVFGRAFTLQHLLLLLFFGYILRFLPSMIQTVVVIFLVIWLLSLFIFPALGGIWPILFIILIIWLLFSFV